MSITVIGRLCYSLSNTAVKHAFSKGFSSNVEPTERLVSKVSSILGKHFTSNFVILRDQRLCEKKPCYCKMDSRTDMQDPFLCQQIQDIEALWKDVHFALNQTIPRKN